MGRAIFLQARWHMGVALLSVALVAGCGGDGGSVASTPVPTPSPTPSPTPTPTPTPTPSPTPSSAFLTTEYYRSTGPSQHNAITAWSSGYNGAGVTIGIVDSGIDTTSPEFAGRIDSASKDVAGNRSLTNPDDDHGTNVAMVAAAARDNTGIMGIAFNAEIAMFRADTPGTCATYDATKPDSGCSFLDTDIAAGVNAAVAAGAKVINLSLGGSSPSAELRTAVANATAAGVVFVIAAGNDGASTDPTKDPTNPDPFAAGLQAVGNGAVIIAGSVDANNVISTFSNKAGSEANWYLAARGEDVCCVYQNGVLKVVTNPDGSKSVYVFSGTSFSAPQIAGAVALLREAFPRLTAAQVVDLLLRTALDAGASGTDPIYGRGILDIAAAFSPQGTTSLAGSTVAMPLGDTALVTSAPMGDAAAGTAGLSTVILDGYQRAFRVNLSNEVRTAQVPPRLANALAGETRHVSLGNDRLSLAFTVDGRGNVGRLPWSGALRLSRSDAEAARVLAGRVVARIAPDAQIAFGFSQGADGLVAQLQGHNQPAFLIARAPLDDTGFGQEGETSYAIRHALGRWGLTISAENGSAVSGAPVQFATSLVQRPRSDHDQRFGVAVDRRFGALAASLSASWLKEDHTIMGARLHQGFGPGGADSLFLDAGTSWDPGRWHFGAAWRSGFTWAHAGGSIAGTSRLVTSAWSFDATHDDVIMPGDSIGLRIAQPLRVESGGITLNLPVDYSYVTLTPTYAAHTLALSPKGREVDTELVWRGPLWNGSAMASLFYRTDPGHYAALRDDQGVAISWVSKF